MKAELEKEKNRNPHPVGIIVVNQEIKVSPSRLDRSGDQVSDMNQGIQQKESLPALQERNIESPKEDVLRNNYVREKEDRDEADLDENEVEALVPKFSFIDTSLVREVKDVNIVCLEPCPFLEDCIQYHDELLIKGRKSSKHKAVHDAIGVPNCGSPAHLRGQCKLAFKDKFSAELVNKYSNLVGEVNKYGEKY